MLKRTLLSACALVSLTAITIGQPAPPAQQMQPQSPSRPSTEAPNRPADRQTTPSRTDSSDAAQARMRQLQGLKFGLYQVQSSDSLASNLTGIDVYNPQNESIGEIEDVLIDGNKSLRALIVSVGGFLGIGTRYVAVEPSSLLFSEDSSGSARAYINADKNALMSAPEFKYEGPFKRGQVGAAGAHGTTGSGGARDDSMR